jgi:hypothetical protein
MTSLRSDSRHLYRTLVGIGSPPRLEECLDESSIDCIHAFSPQSMMVRRNMACLRSDSRHLDRTLVIIESPSQLKELGRTPLSISNGCVSTYSRIVVYYEVRCMDKSHLRLVAPKQKGGVAVLLPGTAPFGESSINCTLTFSHQSMMAARRNMSSSRSDSRRYFTKSFFLF